MPKLEVTNNWEDLSYEFNGIEVPKNLEGSVKLANGDELEYRPEELTASYSDHGHTHTVKQFVLLVDLKYNGVLITVPLAKVGDIVSINPYVF